MFVYLVGYIIGYLRGYTLGYPIGYITCSSKYYVTIKAR